MNSTLVMTALESYLRGSHPIFKGGLFGQLVQREYDQMRPGWEAYKQRIENYKEGEHPYRWARVQRNVAKDTVVHVRMTDTGIQEAIQTLVSGQLRAVEP